jgi:hypothetical protein
VAWIDNKPAVATLSSGGVIADELTGIDLVILIPAVQNWLDLSFLCSTEYTHVR